MTGFRFDDAEISRGVDEIRVHGQRPAIQLTCLCSQAVLLLDVGEGGEYLGIVRKLRDCGAQKAFGMRLGRLQTIVCQRLPGQAKVTKIVLGIEGVWKGNEAQLCGQRAYS